MSQEVLSIDGSRSTNAFVGETRSTADYRTIPGDDSLGIRDQAMGIISSVLAQDQMANPEAAERLRAHLSAHPGRPELALLEHLMETGRLNRSSPGRC